MEPLMAEMRDCRHGSLRRACEVCRLETDLEVAEGHIAGLESDVDRLQAVLCMTVARLGGTVEGRPTERVNFLQRIDALCAMRGSGHARSV